MLLIKNAHIYTITNGEIINGDILIKDGKIAEIKEEIIADAEIIDAEGLNVFPGLIDCHSHLGGMNFAQNTAIDDCNEMTNSLTPQMNIKYGTDPQSEDFEFAYKSGITSLGLTPGSGNLLCGLACAVKTFGDNIFDMIIKDPFALKVAFGGNPKGVYAPRNQAPYTRMSMPTMILELFEKAKKYDNDKKEAKNKNEALPEYDAQLEALIPVLNKELPLKIHCTQFDMLSAMEVANTLDVKYSLEHVWGATKYIDELIEGKADVVFGPIGSRKTYGEGRIIDIESVKTLDEKGVLVALTADSPIIGIDTLIHHVGEAVRNGVSYDRAIRMITINAAKIMGLEDRIGSIEVGKDADIAIFKGLPGFDVNSNAVYTIINGKVIYKSN